MNGYLVSLLKRANAPEQTIMKTLRHGQFCSLMGAMLSSQDGPLAAEAAEAAVVGDKSNVDAALALNLDANGPAARLPDQEGAPDLQPVRAAAGQAGAAAQWIISPGRPVKYATATLGVQLRALLRRVLEWPLSAPLAAQAVVRTRGVSVAGEPRSADVSLTRSQAKFFTRRHTLLTEGLNAEELRQLRGTRVVSIVQFLLVNPHLPTDSASRRVIVQVDALPTPTPPEDPKTGLTVVDRGSHHRCFLRAETLGDVVALGKGAPGRADAPPSRLRWWTVLRVGVESPQVDALFMGD